MTGHPGQRAFGRNAGLDPFVLVLGLRAGFRHDGLETVNKLDRTWRPTELAGKPFGQIARILLHPVDVWMDGKNSFRMFCGEVTPLPGRTRLPKNRPSLRRRSAEVASVALVK